MRRHSIWYRALVVVWSLWLAVALCEPMELHACPMHDAMSSMAGMAGMSANGGRDVLQEQPAAGTLATCTCLTCCGTNGVATSGTSRPPAGDHRVSKELVDASAAFRPRIQRPHALPFGTAPPLAASSI